MRKVIVTTTINPPTSAIRLFDAMPDWELVVVGDLKTPADYRLDRGLYMDPASQEEYDRELSDAIGWNCIQRRNFGLLVAHERGADVVALVDDDNIPLAGWGQDLLLGRGVPVNFYETDLPAFDPIGATNHAELWHRGYPLQLVPRRNYGSRSLRRITPHIQADFWNGDPDVDAICRMLHAPACHFDDACFPMAANKPGPFNSQNTFLSGDVLAEYFLFPGVGRMDDIWASYRAQAVGFRVVYSRASVFQDRNQHDPVEDMRQEYLGYELTLRIVEELAADVNALQNHVSPRARHAYELFKRHFR